MKTDLPALSHRGQRRKDVHSHGKYPEWIGLKHGDHQCMRHRHRQHFQFFFSTFNLIRPPRSATHNRRCSVRPFMGPCHRCAKMKVSRISYKVIFLVSARVTEMERSLERDHCVSTIEDIRRAVQNGRCQIFPHFRVMRDITCRPNLTEMHECTQYR